MEPDELLKIVQRRGSHARIQGDEVAIQTCLFCGNEKWNLELNAPRGVFSCWACSTSGTLRNLLAERFRYVVHIPVNLEADGRWPALPPDHLEMQTCPVTDVQSAVDYLKKRGITMADMIQHRIMFCLEEKSPLKNRILFPVRTYFDNALVGYVGRSYLGEKPKYLATYPFKVIAGFSKFSAVHVLVEGMIDGIAVYRAGYGAAVLLGQADSRLEEWAARIQPNEKIIVLLDGSAQEEAGKIYHRILPMHELTYIFALPPKLDPGMLEPDAVRAIVHNVLQE